MEANNFPYFLIKIHFIQVQGRSLQQCTTAPRPDLLHLQPAFQGWLAAELQVVVLPEEPPGGVLELKVCRGAFIGLFTDPG